MMAPTLTPAAVVERAAHLADAEGYDALTLARVARSLGVQSPSLYAHIRSLDALRDGVAMLAFGELAAAVADAVMGRSGMDALSGYADAHRSYAFRRPGCWEALQRPSGAEVPASPAARRLVEVTTAVFRGYGLALPNLVHGIRIVGSAINGFVTLERAGSFAHSEPPADSSWPELVAALDAMLRTFAARPGTRPDAPPDASPPPEPATAVHPGLADTPGATP